MILAIDALPLEYKGACDRELTHSCPFAGSLTKFFDVYYDHTTRTTSGHYITASLSTSDTKIHRTARIGSGPLQPPEQKTPCALRFYYFYAGKFAGDSNFVVHLRHCTGLKCNETVRFSLNYKEYFANFIKISFVW